MLSKTKNKKLDLSFIKEMPKIFTKKFDLEVLLTILNELSNENFAEVMSPVTAQFVIRHSHCPV